MRLFVAIQFSPVVKTALLEAVSTLKRKGTGTFTRPENLHLTLAFIGETEDLPGAKAALDAVCAGGPVSLTVGGLGHFDDLWWTGIRENPKLEKLALAIQSALREQGFSIEKRAWKPHVTLVRRWRGPEPRLTVPDTAMWVDRVSLMRSDRVEGKLVYTEVSAFRL